MSSPTFEAVASIAVRLSDADTPVMFVVTAVASMMLVAARLIAVAQRVED